LRRSAPTPDATPLRKLLCIYQHAPTPGAPGIYRHRLYLSELTRRGWHVDLVSTPINYMQATVPERYAGKSYVREVIGGVVHHWVWAYPCIHRSRWHRAWNYATFAGTAMMRGTTLSPPDVIWASSPPLSVGSVGQLLAKRFRRPWILEIRDLWPESAASVGWLSEESTLYRALELMARRHAARADAVIVPSPGLVEGIQAHRAGLVSVVPGVVSDTSRSLESRRRARVQFRVDPNACLFTYVGALGIANGLDLLLDAASALTGDKRMSFLVVGDGSDRRRLEEEVRRRHITTLQIVGAMRKEAVPDILAASDVCLHLLRPDPLFAAALPSKILEYFGAHRPVITTVGGLPERLATESGGGFARTVTTLVAEFIRWTVMSPEERRRHGEEAFRYGIDNFSREASVDKLDSLLVDVIRRDRRSRRS
jgi:glycosyltransferase involved in cell wall biosynthesis